MHFGEIRGVLSAALACALATSCNTSGGSAADAAAGASGGGTIAGGGAGGAAGGTTSVIGAGGTGVVGQGGAVGAGGIGAQGAGGRSASGGSSGAANGGAGGIVGSGGSLPGSGGSPVDGGATSGAIGAALLASLGANTVLIGGSMDDATASKAPFDGRYLYLSGGLFDGSAPCASCASGCTSAGASCANTAGCGWWGCWQYDQDPPGQYVIGFVGSNEKATWQGAARRQIPWFTYYEELQTSGLPEGTTQVAALNDVAFLTRYLADWRFVLQKIGSHVALLHIEPDFWGYVEQQSENPHAIAAKVASANATDCADQENSAAGLARCMIHMVRVYAPNAKVGLHASAWGTKMDVFGNTDKKLDVAAEAKKMAAFLDALGAKDGDFIVSDPSDRDAGYYQSIGRKAWWDATNATLPNFHQALSWTKTLAESLGLPVFFWQIPVGNMNLDNTTDHYQDNRLDYFFAHMDEVVDAHIVGLFFGAGAGGMTTPETDGGNFVAKTTAYRNAGGAKLSP